MSVKHRAVTVASTPTSITAEESGLAPSVVGWAAVLTNASSQSVFLGGPDVSATVYGYELKAGASLPLDLTPTDNVFGIVASGTAVVRALHTGV